DDLVTGVQTCALPIYLRGGRSGGGRRAVSGPGAGSSPSRDRPGVGAPRVAARAGRRGRREPPRRGSRGRRAPPGAPRGQTPTPRSGERRVGEGGGPPW